MLLSFLTFGVTVSGFSQSPTVTQNVTTTLTLGLKRGTSLLNIPFRGERFFLDTTHVSLHDGGVGLSLFPETDALHLSFHTCFGLGGVANVRWKRSRISWWVLLSRTRAPTTPVFRWVVYVVWLADHPHACHWYRKIEKERPHLVPSMFTLLFWCGVAWLRGKRRPE